MEPNTGAVLTIDGLAEHLEIPKSTLYKLAQESKVPAQTVRRHSVSRKEAIDHWLEKTLRPRTAKSKERCS